MNKELNELLAYGLKEKLLDAADYEYAANELLFLLKLNDFKREEVDEEIDFFDVIKKLCDYAFEQGLIPTNTVQDYDHFEAKLVDCLLPRPSELNRRFRALYKKAPKYAMDDFYHLSQKSNYIKTKRIEKNIHFEYVGKYAPLQISINLSKPEKDPMAILKQAEATHFDYPKCALCMENVGYYGDDTHASRSNHRVVTMTLNHEKDAFGIQFSPYSYFNEHLICLKKEHIPMSVDHNTFYELVDFVNQIPHYTIGSNAGIKIVGGSILSHYHFQGGNATFPIEQARVLTEYKTDKVKVQILDWPLNVIRVVGANEYKVLDKVEEIYQAWLNYSNPELQIYAKTEEEIHNAVTPILKIQEGKYNFYLVLRNNFTTEERPYGLYHPRDEYFHIKKENIGLIEVMGLAILPGRLEKELSIIKDVLLGVKDSKDYPEIKQHEPWIEELKTKSFEEATIDEFLNNEVGLVFEKVLEDCGVFKEENRKEYYSFVEKAI